MGIFNVALHFSTPLYLIGANLGDVTGTMDMPMKAAYMLEGT